VYLTAVGLDHKNIIGITSDAAMIGVENDFFKFFKDKVDVVDTIQVTCEEYVILYLFHRCQLFS